MLCLCLALFEVCDPCDAGTAAAKAARRLHSWGLQMELAEEFEMALAFSLTSTASSSAQTRDTEARSVASSALSDCLMLGLSSSEELDILSIEASDLGDSPTQSPQYEELVQIVIRAVAKLNICWPAEKWEAQKKTASCSQKHNLHVGACRSFRISLRRCEDPGKSHIHLVF